MVVALSGTVLATRCCPMKRVIKTLLICLWGAVILQACGQGAASSAFEGHSGQSFSMGIGAPNPEDAFDMPNTNNMMYFSDWNCPAGFGIERRDLRAEVTRIEEQAENGVRSFSGGSYYRISITTKDGRDFSAEDIAWDLSSPSLVLGFLGSTVAIPFEKIRVRSSGIFWVTQALWHNTADGSLVSISISDREQIVPGTYLVGFSFLDNRGIMHCLNQFPTMVMGSDSIALPFVEQPGDGTGVDNAPSN